MTMVVRVIAASVAAYVHDAKVMTVQAAKQGSKQPDQTALIQLEQYEDAQLKAATFPMTDVAVDIFSLSFSLCMRPLLSCGGWHPSEIKMHAASRCSVRRLTAHAGGEQTSPPSVIAGVDPDPRGAIAVLHDDVLYTCVDLPTEKTRSGRIRHSLSSLATNLSTSLEGTTASTFVERATGSFNASPGASVQQGIGVGICMGALAACGHSVSTLHPNEWRPAFGLPNASSEKGKGKESNIALAEELFPQSTHPTADSVTRRGGRADAALLAAFARLREAASRNEESNLLPTLYRTTLKWEWIEDVDAELMHAYPHLFFQQTDELRDTAASYGLKRGGSKRALISKVAKAETDTKHAVRNLKASEESNKSATQLIFAEAAQQQQHLLSVLRAMRVDDLKNECKERKLKSSGTKRELIRRLVEQRLVSSDFTAKELQSLAERRGQCKSGTKAELAARLNGTEQPSGRSNARDSTGATVDTGKDEEGTGADETNDGALRSSHTRAVSS